MIFYQAPIDVYVFVPLGLRYQVILEDDFNVNNKVLVQYKNGSRNIPLIQLIGHLYSL